MLPLLGEPIPDPWLNYLTLAALRRPERHALLPDGLVHSMTVMGTVTLIGVIGHRSVGGNNNRMGSGISRIAFSHQFCARSICRCLGETGHRNNRQQTCK